MDLYRAVMCLLICDMFWRIHSTEDTVVSTSVGTVKGIRQSVLGKDIDAFLGIPYAKPPTGPFRFKRPQPLPPWKGVLNAVRKPAPCPQYVKGMERVSWVDAGQDWSEDCLFLNVWAPSDNDEKKAVMFFIHGGGFFCGSSRLGVYDGRALAALGDVVVVTVNYRLGALGFLYLDDDDCPGNQGLADQNMALKWVHDHIAAFGGDPALITVFGESMGSTSTGLHLMSPFSRPLFRRAIMQSCAPNLKAFRYSTEEAIKVANDLAVRVGCRMSELHAVIACLRDVDALELSRVERELGESRQEVRLVALPVYGDEFIPNDPASVLQPEDIKQTEILVGVNNDEGSIILPQLNPKLFNWDAPHISMEEGWENLTKIGRNLRGCEWSKAKAFYTKNLSQDIRVAVGEAIADSVIVCPSSFFAEEYSEVGGTAYFYRFRHRPSKSSLPEWMGCTHFDEIQFVFGIPLLSPQDYTQDDIIVSETVIKIWTTFAKTGVPPEVEGKGWPHYTANHPVAVDVSSRGIVEIIGPRLQHCNFWRCHTDRSHPHE